MREFLEDLAWKFDVKGPYHNGAIFLALTTLLHGIAPVFGGLSGDAMTLFSAALVYAAGVCGLIFGYRWVAYLTFIAMIIGSIVAITGIWAPSPVPGWIYGGIVAANWMTVIALFMPLWRTPA